MMILKIEFLKWSLRFVAHQNARDFHAVMETINNGKWSADCEIIRSEDIGTVLAATCRSAAMAATTYTKNLKKKSGG